MTDRLDLGSYRHEEGYFLLRPDHEDVPYTAGADDGDRYRHVFTYRGSRPAIKEAALELIASARHKVFVASFRIGDTDLLEALYAAADRLRGGVYVISALDQASLHRALSTEDDEVPGADDVRVQNKKFEDMTVRGITVRGHASFHAKFLVVDDRVALVSSANLETPALADRPTRGATGENGFVLSDVDEVLRLSRFFTRLWHGCTYHMPTGRDHTVQEREATPVPCRVPVAGLGHDPAVVWTHDEEHGILETVHHVIAHARRSLLLASFSLNGLTDYPELLLDPLDRAARTHRPRVELLVRARNNHTQTRRGAAALAELGVVVHADSLTHAKATIADDEYGALFSANFDADHGLTSGAEVGVRLRAGPSLREATRHLRHAVAHADLTFAPNPTQRELDQRLGAWWRTAWPFEPIVTVTAPDRVWHRFAAAAATGPVLYTDDRAGGLGLLCGDSTWPLSRQDDLGARTLAHAGPSGHPNTATVLDAWLQTRGRDRLPGRRGLCPAVFNRRKPGW
jgi:phosphatidylserine/phosphatidylglycerophosphate/cardiolipin synthase-like enzyme